MVTLEDPLGPDGLGQLVRVVTPFTFIVQDVNPNPFVGVAPPDGPVTAAVKVIDWPNCALPVFALTTTVGANLETVMVELVTTETEL